MTNILVFSEQDTVACELLSKARELGTPTVAVLGKRAVEKFFEYGAHQVFLDEGEPPENCCADLYADALAQIAEAGNASVVLIGSTKFGKELAGRLAQKLHSGAITDALGLAVQDGQLIVQRYALGGNTIATQVITTERQVIAIMPRTFEAIPQPTTGEIVRVNLKWRAPRVHVVERKAKPAATAHIETAETLIVVGKGFAKQDDLALANQLAQTLQGEVGCTRALAADYHWLGEERMIGISGKRCKPRLLISIGVSGQIQHTVGILGSKIIVAINQDKHAPIFKIADYGLVGDLYHIVPKLTERLQR